MMLLAVDLGSTNMKAALYDEEINLLTIRRTTVRYETADGRVEFDAEQYYQLVLRLMADCLQAQEGTPDKLEQIILTGQAESLVVLGKDNRPVCKAISWMDGRGEAELRELKAAFGSQLCHDITGQPELSCTFPIVKMLWMKHHAQEEFQRANHFLLLKDYIQYRLTGVIAGEYTIYNFSHYFDIRKKKYWGELLDYCGIGLSQLPDLVEPGTVLGPLLPDVARCLGIRGQTVVNTGALDHFCGMLGTGNIRPGMLSESGGTVLTLATMLPQDAVLQDRRIGIHYGPIKDSYAALIVCENGGSCLEWYKNNFIPDKTYEEIDAACTGRAMSDSLVFLPYLIGTSAPEYDPDMSGVFFGLRGHHDRFDLARAVMEGVSFLLRRNIDTIEQYAPGNIIATGGAAKSSLWCKLKAGATGRTVMVPKDNETPCLGAAMMGGVSCGMFAGYESAVSRYVRMEREYLPSDPARYEHKYRLFTQLLDDLGPAFHHR